MYCSRRAREKSRLAGLIPVGYSKQKARALFANEMVGVIQYSLTNNYFNSTSAWAEMLA